MFLFISNNAIVIICTILMIISILAYYKMEKSTAVLNITQGVMPKNLKQVFVSPFKSALSICRHKGILRRIFLLLLTLLFAVISFLRLSYSPLPVWAALLLFLPITLLAVIVFYYCLWIVSILIRKFINVRNIRLNGVFSLIGVLLLLILLAFYVSGETVTSNITFFLIVANLLFCYLLTAISLKQLLKISLEKTSALSLRNMWKVALMEIFFFLVILTMLSFAAYLHYPNAYQFNGSFDLFDAFYHIVITFGTVGYGDITPTCTFTKFVSILTVFTSIICITILLSSMMSLSKEEK